MKLDVVLGLQWGDEGKGKIVDVLAGRYPAVARFQGGPNAGQCFSAESECGDVQQVVCGRYFGCRMSFEAQNRLVRRHAAAIVNDLDQCPSGVAEYHGHLCCSRVHCVLDKFLDYRGRSLYDLSGSNHVGDVAW